jgi:hypothetical protein
MRSILCLAVVLSSICVLGVVPVEAQANWTFMVYLNADNNLDPFGLQDVNEMEAIGSSANMNIIVEIDRANEGAKRYFITKDSNTNAITSKVLADMGEIDMGSYKELVSFVQFCKTNYPANNYCLDIWNHGAGWKSRNAGGYYKGISYDDQSGNHITTPQLGSAMAQVKTILGKNCDVVCTDACLMAMIEVAYEIYPSATYFCASEETEPGAGYDYTLLLAGADTLTPNAFAKKIVTAYAQTNSKSAACYSAMDLAKMPDVAAKLNAFGGAISVPAAAASVRTAKSKVKRFAMADYADLNHFAKLVSGKSSASSTKPPAAGGVAVAESTALMSAISSAVILNKMTGGMKNAAGISVYIPQSSAATTYRSLALATAAPKWVTFVMSSKQSLPIASTVASAIRAAADAGDTDALETALADKDAASADLENTVTSSLEKGDLAKIENLVSNLSAEEKELHAKLLSDLKGKVGAMMLENEKENSTLAHLYEILK